MKVVSYSIQYGRGKDDCHQSAAVGWWLDDVFVTPTLAPRDNAAWIGDEARGSYHQPIWAEIDVQRRAS